MVLVGLFIERCARSVRSLALATDAELPATAQGLDSIPEVTTVDEKIHHVLAGQLTAWRARLDALPRPGEIAETAAESDGLDRRLGRRYVEERMEMYRLVGDADLELRSRLDAAPIEDKIARLGSLYRRWSAAAFARTAEEAPEDSVLTGRPEGMAPSPEEVLEREPGSSIEF